MKKNSMQNLVYRNGTDFISRLMAVGIFTIENYNHIGNFKEEVETLVGPAWSPVPIPSMIHAITIFLGFVGSVLFIASGFRKWNRHANLSLLMLCVFMIIITWTWWFRRFGVFVWEVEDEIDRRNRIIHCLKNMSIFGLLLTIKQQHNPTHKLV